MPKPITPITPPEPIPVPPAPDPVPVSVPVSPVAPIATPTYLWATPQQSYHSVRVLADLLGLSVDQKNTLCACIFQESRFKNSAVNHNKNGYGQTTSSDWGICQVNDYFHIGPNRDFPTVDYVVANPEKVVRWMIKLQLAGQLHLWSSYSTGAYKQWLAANSPMWLLKTA